MKRSPASRMRRADMNSMETIALEQADLIDKLAQVNKKLVNELAQYRAIDKEDKEQTVLREAIEALGGDQ